MARVLVTVQPGPGEREAVDAVLGRDAFWLVDGPSRKSVSAASALLSFWPRREFKAGGIRWQDVSDVELMQMATAGVNHVGWHDVPPSVHVACAPGSSAPAVAEHVLAMLLWWTRRLGSHDAAIRAGRIEMGAPVRALRDVRLGLVGFGGVGRAVARMVGPFGTPVRAVSRSGDDEGAPDHVQAVATMDGLAELAAWADVLVVCVPLVRQTLRLIDQGVLATLDGERLVVNVARGHVIDEDALYGWLAADDRHAAALDVWWRYPSGRVESDGGPVSGEAWYPYSRPFHTLQNVLMTPHDAPNVAGFRTEMLAQAARQLRAWLDTGVASHVVDREAHVLDVDGDGR